MGRRIAIGMAFALLLLPAAVARADANEGCELYEVDDARDAELVVYFTKFLDQDETDGSFRDCVLVDEPTDTSQAFYVTLFRQDATVVVHPSNWP